MTYSLTENKSWPMQRYVVPVGGRHAAASLDILLREIRERSGSIHYYFDGTVAKILHGRYGISMGIVDVSIFVDKRFPLIA